MSEQAKAVLWSWARVFLAAGLSYILNALIEGTLISARGVLIASLVALLPIVINWLNPKDTRYGKGYVKGEVIVSGSIPPGGYSTDEV